MIKRRPRILFTIPNLNTAGSGLALFKLLTNLNQEKFDIHVLCLHSKGALFKRFEDFGFKIHILNYTHRMRPILNGLKHCWGISRWLRKNKFDVVYSYHYSADYSEAIAAKLAGSKWVFVKKNMGWFGSSYRAWRLRSFLADSIIIQNNEMKKVFYPKSPKAKLISIGVDTEEYYELEEYPKDLLPFKVTRNTKIIGVVANFVPVKGIEILIDAFNSLYIDHDLRLVLIGDNNNNYGQIITQFVKKLRIPPERICFAGKQTNINEWLNTFDLFVQPSLRGEGSPIAVQEAIASGTLVIGSRICGVEDQISQTPNLLFEPGSTRALSEKIKYVLSLNKAEINLLKLNQKQHLLENYTLEAEVNAVENYLTALTS